MTASPLTEPCSLYRFTVWDPNTGYTTKRRGYIGETGRMPIERLVEHLRARYPWGDTVVGWEVDDRSFADKAAVVAAERVAVQRERPLYNDEWNRGNPDRIGYAEQVRQRHERDAAAGRPLWQPGDRTRRLARAGRRRPVAVRRGGWRVPRRVWRAVPAVVVWVGLAVLAGWVLPDRLPWTDAVWVSSAAASMGVGVLTPQSRRRRRR